MKMRDTVIEMHLWNHESTFLFFPIYEVGMEPERPIFRKLILLMVAGGLGGCAWLPGHYAYETHAAVQSPRPTGPVVFNTYFEPTHSRPERRLTVYGNPYTYRMTVFTREEMPHLGIHRARILLDSGRTVPLRDAFRLEKISDLAGAEGLEGYRVYSNRLPVSGITLPYEKDFQVAFWLKTSPSDSKWRHRRENRNLGIDSFFPIQ